MFQKNLIVWKPSLVWINYGLGLLVSEELNSVETVTDDMRSPLVFWFQKNLIVWKLFEIGLCERIFFVFQKNLIVWKLSIPEHNLLILLSFQKNLIVWKLYWLAYSLIVSA